ncbi:hypothetical protein CJ030_MR0G004811 [Morella rubra]|uniref:Uncharacterized protein n=1 Tax=Morella rubra TaxID=262757 RepID=A0A6A1ULL4_9ROSI|nr:hypothetical protein CJ030_MR0G004811 [Morella rubra]
MEKSPMLSGTKAFIPVLLLLLIWSSSVRADGFRDSMELTYPHGEVMIRIKARKLLGRVDTLSDYQYPSANPTHEPKKGSPGGKGSNNP